jgi:DNA repair photolyase
METITRKSLLYKSGLGFFCINHVQGCSHACRYPCYAYMMAHSHGRIKSFHDWCAPKLVENAGQLLKKELARKKIKPDNIHLCLSTDPFMKGYPAVVEMSLDLIGIINSFEIPCSVLTKGILPAELADHERFLASNSYGISLVSVDENFRREWEPGAASYSERINALKHLHEQGCKTFVHMEPYPTPNILAQDIEKIQEAVVFADQIDFGGWNYYDKVKQFSSHEKFYREQNNIVQRFCREHGINTEA